MLLLRVLRASGVLRHRLQIEAKILYHRVGEELCAHLAHFGFGISAIVGFQLYLDVFAHAYALDGFEAEHLQSAFYCQSLGIIHHWL